MTVHFPPPVEELLDCKYEWCGRIGAHGFKREEHRKEHYMKVHMKGTESSKNGKGGRVPPAINRPPGLDPLFSSSPSDYPCLHPNCGHISSRAQDLKRHMTVHFPPPVEELLDCKYEWCGRIGAHGFKREEHRKEHYMKVHMKETEYPKTGKGGRSDRRGGKGGKFFGGVSITGAPLPKDSHEKANANTLVPAPVPTPVKLQAVEKKDAAKERSSLTPGGPEASELSPNLGKASPDQEVIGLKASAKAEDKLAIAEPQLLARFLGRMGYQQEARLKVEWDVLGFMKDQFSDDEYPNTILGSVVTITGSVHQAQATTCAEYVKQNWGAHGSRILDTLQDALHSPTHTSQSRSGFSFEDGYTSDDSALSSCPELEFDVSQGQVCLNFKSGTLDAIVETVQQLAWMGTALRTSADGGVQYCEPKLKKDSKADEGGPIVLNITFQTSSLDEEDQSCWLSLFANPVIARGFPVPKREHGEQGLEVPLEIMAALGGARHVTEFEGGVLLKGYSVMLIPVKRHSKSIQWHMIRRNDEERVLYRDVSNACPNRAMLDEVDHESLANTRAFLGWWKSAETCLGTADAAYDNIDWSPAREIRRTPNLSGASIGFQNILTGQLNFNLGAKDGRSHFSQKGPFEKIIQCAAKIPVTLYDVADRRAWLVPSLDVILHIIQTRHHLSPYKIDGKTVELTPVISEKGRAAPTEAIAANRKRPLYEPDIATGKVYYFQDAILDIWSQIDGMIVKEDSIKACAGQALHGTTRIKLHGWEYMSLVHEKNHHRRKETTIAKSSGGWVDLINDVDCVVLFATGLGEIIRPVSDLNNLCSSWKSLPIGKDFLAAGVPILEQLYSEAGSRLSHKHLSTTHLQWHRGSILFERCSDMNSICCKCDRTQQIYHDSVFTFGHVQLPGKLEENGCVVFGQAHHTFKLRNSIAVRENVGHRLLNASIQDEGAIMRNSKEDSFSLSSPFPRSVTPELEGLNGHATQTTQRPTSPLNFPDGLLQDQMVTLNRRRNMSHIQTPESNIWGGSGSRNDGILSSEDHQTCSTGYQSTTKQCKKVLRPENASINAMCSSEIVYAPAHVWNNVRKNVRQKSLVRGYCSRSYGCSCVACLEVAFESSRSTESSSTMTKTQRNVTSMVGRHERQRV